MSVLTTRYDASPTLAKFHKSKAFFRGVRGPIGSGKSVGMCMEIFRRMREQEPGVDGKRKTRFAIIRNTYPELETTTIKTWLDWFPEDPFGKMNRAKPMCHHVEYGDVSSEVYFLALDRPEDIKKLLSLELTGIFFNEARELPLNVITTGLDRVGRYPSQRDRPSHISKENWPTWCGGIADTNPPDEDHWWPMMAGDAPLEEDITPPDNWEFWAQPPAAFEDKVDGKTVWRINLDAENLDNLRSDYYPNLIQGKRNQHVRVYVGNKYGTVNEGKLVYNEYSDDLHLATQPLTHIPGRNIIVGLDFGQTPAASFSQQTTHGQWQDIHELVTEGIGAERFGALLKLEIARVFPGVPWSSFEFWGDPSGDYAQSGTDKTYFQILKGLGIQVRAAPTQDPFMRIEAGRKPMEMVIGGVLGYAISPTCKTLLKGFRSGYKYPKINSSGSVRYSDKPEKNKFSHVHEARQYALCGAGYVKVLRKGDRDKFGGMKNTGPIRAKTLIS